jgi:hypothetical protein
MPPSMITSVLIIAAISLTIGYVVGWLIATLRTDKQVEKAEDQPVAKDTILPDHRLLLRTWRNTKNSSLMIELAGRMLAGPEMLKLEERRELVELLREISRWLGVPEEAFPVPRSTTVESTGVQSSGGCASPSVGSEKKEVESLRPSLIGGVTTVIADGLSPQQQSTLREAPLSIVQQIDEIFQQKLADSPYKGERAYITEDSRKGVIVWVGNSMYEGVGAMPEGDMKNLLRASVQDWERIQEQLRRRNETK